MRYRAFISYSHADADAARRLMKRLETYRVPARLVGTTGAHGPIGPRLGAFFRDRDELPSAGRLDDALLGVLAESAAMILICSPASARSRWVNAEVEAFRRLHGASQIYCVVVAGDPASDDPEQACFPPALRAPDADGRPIEPLAADARRVGDGRERAFLKLVAGLLGVGFDQLARREVQRRLRRMAWLVTASMAGMALTSVLAVTAYLARNDAQRRQAQAEDLLGFMLGDLRAKLSTVGRLDLMRSVDDKATGYFATLSADDLSDRTLSEQARSLTGIGEVRLQEGKHQEAMAAFKEAHARAAALAGRAPRDGQRLFDLAQAEFWIGSVAWQQNRFDEATRWLTRYRDSAIALAAMSRDNIDWQLEVAYGHHNLAVLDHSLGRYAEADRGFAAELDLRRALDRQRPADTKERYDIADAESWRGSTAMAEGRLGDARAHFGAAIAALERNRRDEPTHARWQIELIHKQLLLAWAVAVGGEREVADSMVRSTVATAQRLALQDPTNMHWQSALAAGLNWRARLAQPQDTAQATADAEAAERAQVAAHTAEASDALALVWLVRTRLLLAELCQARDELQAARLWLRQAELVLLPAWQSRPSERLRLEMARLRVLEGQLAQVTEEPAGAAHLAWQDTVRLLTADAQAAPPFERLDPLVRALLLLDRADDARPHLDRLTRAGYAPLTPWPTGATGAAARRLPTDRPAPARHP